MLPSTVIICYFSVLHHCEALKSIKVSKVFQYHTFKNDARQTFHSIESTKAIKNYQSAKSRPQFSPYCPEIWLAVQQNLSAGY